jgi:hypothetical protein
MAVTIMAIEPAALRYKLRIQRRPCEKKTSVAASAYPSAA